MTTNPKLLFSAEDFIYPNNKGDAVLIVARKSAEVANALHQERCVLNKNVNALLDQQREMLDSKDKEITRLREALERIIALSHSWVTYELIRIKAKNALEGK